MNRRLSMLLTVATLAFVFAFSAMALAYNEAPMLSERVKAGALPPVDQRLPENPLVIKPVHEIGQYGGTWYRYTNNRDWAYVRMLMYGHSPLRWTDDGLGIAGNWIEKWSSNADATVWTLNVRKGIKWSDGAPFSAKDFMFWWNDMVLNQEMSDVVPDMFIAAGKTAEITSPDDYTLVVKFAGPSPMLPERMAMWINAGTGERMVVPSHYLKPFHPKYNKEYKDFEVFEEKMEWWFNPECPVLTAWRPVEHKAASKLVLERNPFYYGVDTAGNQLPYIDRIEVSYVEDLEVVKLKLLNGESQMQVRPYVSMTDLAMLKKGEKAANYKVVLWDSGSGTGPIFYTNWNHPDPEKQSVYRKAEFRRALSLAIDRGRIQKMLFFGLGEQTTGTFSPKAVEYHRSEEGKKLYKDWRDSYNAYKPEEAKKLLDSIGVVDKNGDGWRDLPSGKDLTVRVDRDSAANKQDTQTNEMVKTDWEAIGVRTILNPVDSSQMTVLDQTAMFDVRDSWELGDGPNHLVFPQWVVPIDLSRWAPLNGAWYSVQGTAKEGTELDKAVRDRTPPREKPEAGGPIERLQQLYTKAKVEPSQDERDRLVREIVKIHINEGPFFIGTVSNYPRVVVVSNKMKNVPEKSDLAMGGFVNPWIVPYPAITMPETYFLTK